MFREQLCKYVEAWRNVSTPRGIRNAENGAGFSWPDSQRIRVTADGKKVVDVVEVQSPGQSRKFMNAKVAAIKKALGAQAGNVEWLLPSKGAVRNTGPTQ